MKAWKNYPQKLLIFSFSVMPRPKISQIPNICSIKIAHCVTYIQRFWLQQGKMHFTSKSVPLDVEINVRFFHKIEKKTFKAKIEESQFIFFWIKIHAGKYSLKYMDIISEPYYLCGNNIFIIGSIKAARKCVNREAKGEEKLPCFIGSFWGQERKEEGVVKGGFF